VGSMMVLLNIFLSKDWAIEYLRGRLTEIYDRELIDQLFPYKKQHYFNLDNMETIKDHELEEFGFHEPENSESLFGMQDTEHLYHFREKKLDQIKVNSDFPK